MLFINIVNLGFFNSRSKSRTKHNDKGNFSDILLQCDVQTTISLHNVSTSKHKNVIFALLSAGMEVLITFYMKSEKQNAG